TDGLKGAGPFTLFAPADAAFASLPEKTLDSLLADTAQLARVLQFHVVPQKLTAADITNGMTVTTLMGQQLTFGVSGGNMTVNGANINASALPASNGTIFIVDSVLLPAQ
ncbi:MAG: fasciclin domain-containing protein, partial [Caldilineaceae bacterium]